MKKIKKQYIIFLIIFTVIIASSIGFYLLKKNLKTNKEPKVELYTIVPGEKVFVNGIITPEQTESVYLDATKGTVNTVSVKDGQVVKKGDILFSYKNEQITEQINQTNLQLTASKNQKKELLAQQKAQEEALKNQALLANQNLDSENKGSENLNTQNLSQQSLSTSSIDSQISLYEEQINSLKKKEYSTVTTPIDGKVILHDATNSMGSPYITIESINFYVKGSINEKEQPKLKENQIADIIVLSTNKTLKGKITNIGNRPLSAELTIKDAASANSNISSYEVNISLDSQEEITNGFHVQATIKLMDNGIEIPKSAILQDGNEYYVFKAVDKKLVKQVITYTEGSSDKVVVNSGLSENEEIAIKPNEEMKEGMAIE